MIPTSNHNSQISLLDASLLYIFWFLHQTTTLSTLAQGAHPLYIFWFLHQTTTNQETKDALLSCISFDSYIKPQLQSLLLLSYKVVYLLIPTSNHNSPPIVMFVSPVVYLLIPTSNHNRNIQILTQFKLYIFWFLHQTTTFSSFAICSLCCISFDSYIKPQPIQNKGCLIEVVYLLIPTSNHNYCRQKLGQVRVVYLLIPTSNHNSVPLEAHQWVVVYLLIPTSNHNRRRLAYFCQKVVYLLIPTSNHNLNLYLYFFCWLYIFWFLHQTTTHAA